MSTVKSNNDGYAKFVNSGAGSFLADKLGLPKPIELRRYEADKPLLDGPVIVAGSGRLAAGLQEVLKGDYEVVDTSYSDKVSGVVVDATGISKVEEAHELFDILNPLVRRIKASGRIVVIGTTPELTDSVETHIAQRGLEGFTRSLAKEMRKGATVQLVHVDPTVDAKSTGLESTLRFILSGKSAYVDAQVFHVNDSKVDAPDWKRPLDGKIAVVTGAARGIGATIAEVLARDGAHVICVDIPAAGEHLSETANKVGGTSLPLDVTNADAAQKLADHVKQRHNSGIDVIVHNAGITRDKTLAGMDEARWGAVMAVNLAAPERITEKLLDLGALNDGGRVIGVSSLSGIAGNRGQTNYAYTKAGMIGLVDSMSKTLADKNITVNAVAPGFIETQMTAAIPFGTREAGRRMNAMQQGGQTIDVAETIAFFASSASAAVTGNVIRVCGQSLLGA